MRKTIKVAEAVARIYDGASLMIGGFMAVGTPPRLIDEMVRQGRKDLTIIANDTARPGVGIGKLIDAKPFVDGINWATGYDMTTGRPIENPEARYGETGKPFVSLPGPMGAHSWPPMSFTSSHSACHCAT